MEIIIGIAIIALVFFLLGSKKSTNEVTSVSVNELRQEYINLTEIRERVPPDPASMPFETLLDRTQSENTWFERYKALPSDYQQSADIQKQYEKKKIFTKQLQVELMKRSLAESGKNIEDTLIPIMQRSIELMKTGMSEEAAGKQASEEFVSKRDAG